jgi:hypothetical protein
MTRSKTWLSLLTLLLALLLSETAEGKRRRRTARPKRVPLTVRMNNPCAISWSYGNPERPTGFFWALQNARIPVAKGSKDSRGNFVMFFRTVADGEHACRLLLQSEFYCDLTVERAIRKWDGGRTWVDYARYVVRRAHLAWNRRMRSLTAPELTRFRQAQTEWESGRTKPGTLLATK